MTKNIKKPNDSLKTHNLLDLIKERYHNTKHLNIVENPYARYVIQELDFLIYCADNVLNHGWIDIHDELPKPFESVLLYGKKHNGKPMIEIGYLNPNLTKDYGLNQSFSLKVAVEYWQPLPNSPQKIKEQDND